MARAYQLHEERDRAIEWADRALEVAERFYLVPVIADALLTKGGAMAVNGRVWEGVGLAQAGLLLADQHGLTATSLRAKIGLTGSLTVYDPKEAYRIGLEAYEQARRFGQRHGAAIAAANAGEAALDLGAFGEAIAMLREVRALDLEGTDSIAVEGVLLELVSVIGEPTADPLAALAARGDESDPVFGSTLHLASVWASLADGRFDDAYRSGLRIAELSGLNRPYGLLCAARAAIRGNDLAGARHAVESLIALRVRGPALDASRTAVEAGVLALGGDWPGAAGRYQAALRGLRELGMTFHVGLTSLDLISVAPSGDALAAQAADEARGLLEEIGARPFVAQLEDLLERHAAARPAGVRASDSASTGAGTVRAAPIGGVEAS